MEVSYTESQWLLRNPFMWVIPPVLGLVLWSLAQPDAEPVILVPVAALLVGLLFGRMTTTVADDRLKLRLWPVWGRTVALKDIQNARLIEYKWSQYGGWGIRWGQRAWAFSVWGKDAIRLQLRGRDVVIQSPDADALLTALRGQGVDAVDTTDATPY